MKWGSGGEGRGGCGVGMGKMEGGWGGLRRRERLRFVCVDVCVLEEEEVGGRYPKGVETNKSLCRLCADTQLV